MSRVIHLSKRLRLALLIALALLVVLYVVDVTGLGKDTLAVAVPVENSDGARASFLADYGWQIDPSPEEVCEITLPNELDRVMEIYNDLQRSQDFDLRPYLGKTVTRYTYRVLNYPDGSDEVRANLLVYENAVIGGDVCSLAMDGFMQGFSQEDAGFSRRLFSLPVTP